MKEAINTTIRGKYRVISCKAGTLDGHGYENTYLASATYTLHVETAGGTADFGFLSVEKAKATADLFWDNGTTDYITITNDATTDVLYLYEAGATYTPHVETAEVLYLYEVAATYTLHVETTGGAADFGFQSMKKAKTVAELLWNSSTTDRITITNDDTSEVLYLYEAASELPF